MTAANTVIKVLHAFGRPEDYQTAGATPGSSIRSNWNPCLIETQSEFLALLIHAAMIVEGFRLIGFADAYNGLFIHLL